MDAADEKIVNNYLKLLEQLNPAMKLDLIDKLIKSVKSRVSTTSRMEAAFGAWQSDETAEQIIELIYNSRNTNRKIEEL